MSLIHAIILGVVQGITEFLPVSSSGHLILVPWFFDWRFFLENPELNKTFDVALHVGTFLALLAYFWREIGRLIVSFFRTITRRRNESPEERLVWYLLVGTIPAGIAGVALESFIEDQLGRPWLIAILLAVFGLVIYVVDRYAPQRRDIDDMRWSDAIWIGVAQVLALAPGVSRSGITMVTGRGLGLDRESAVRYSFLLSIPVTGAAAAYKLLKVAMNGLPPGTTGPFIWGTLFSAVAGFIVVAFLLSWVRKHTFLIFAVYRWALAALVLFVILMGWRAAGGL
jgi:undecaprenyl-diphosphatase